MKTKFCLILGLFSIIGFGQTNKINDIDLSKINVEYLIEDLNNNGEIAFFINGKQYPKSLLRTIKPEFINNFDAKPESKEFPNGAIEITIDKNKVIKPISVKELLDKQTNLKQSNNIYFIDDQLIEEKSVNYFVDENNILLITIKPIKNADLQYNLIKIYTKSDKNINDFKNPKLKLYNNPLF